MQKLVTGECRALLTLKLQTPTAYVVSLRLNDMQFNTLQKLRGACLRFSCTMSSCAQCRVVSQGHMRTESVL